MPIDPSNRIGGEYNSFSSSEPEPIVSEPESTYGFLNQFGEHLTFEERRSALEGEVFSIPENCFMELDSASSEENFFRFKGIIYNTYLNIGPETGNLFKFANLGTGRTASLPGAFAIYYHGTFCVENPGYYSFRLVSNDDCSIQIDNKEISQSDELIYLDNTKHKLEISFFHCVGNKDVILKLLWKPQNGPEELFSPRIDFYDFDESDRSAAWWTDDLKYAGYSGGVGGKAAPASPSFSTDLTIWSIPSEASVYIDGNEIDEKTPVSYGFDGIGSHEVMLRKKGYEDYVQTIDLREDKKIYVNLSAI